MATQVKSKQVRSSSFDFATRIQLQWVSVNAITGKIIAELPYLEVSTIERRLSNYSSATAELPWDDAPSNWRLATEPMAAVLILLWNGSPLWGGYVQGRVRDLSAATISLSLVTWEGYFDRVLVSTESYKGIPQTDIAVSLINKYGCRRNPTQVIAHTQSSTPKRDRTYDDKDDKTLLSALQDLQGIENGIEFRITWHTTDSVMYYPIVEVRDAYVDKTVAVSFNTESFTAFSVEDKYDSSTGANRIRATSSADGDKRPQSAWVEAYQNTYPVVEESFTPSTSIKNTDVLLSHAKKELAERGNGAHYVTFALDLLTSPQYGELWLEGDTIGWILDEKASQRMPEYKTGKAKCIGWTMNLTSTPTIHPVLDGDGLVG